MLNGAHRCNQSNETHNIREKLCAHYIPLAQSPHLAAPCGFPMLPGGQLG